MKKISLHIKYYTFVSVSILCLFDSSLAQWVNDPSLNTKLVIDPVDPINISALKDFNGGAYVFWEDKKGSANSDIYFIHFDENGEVSFRADGKVVSTRSEFKENPLALVDPSGNSIIM